MQRSGDREENGNRVSWPSRGGSSPRPYLEEGTGALSVPKDGV